MQHDEMPAWCVALVLGVLGAMCGLVMAFVGLLMAGGGHRWYGSLLLGMAAIVAVPLLGVGWAYRDRVAGLVKLGVALAYGATTDLALVAAASELGQAWQMMPGALPLWCALPAGPSTTSRTTFGSQGTAYSMCCARLRTPEGAGALSPEFLLEHSLQPQIPRPGVEDPGKKG
jgi:hypothetical protein